MSFELGSELWWLLFLAVFIGNFVEAVAGFGSVLIALVIALLVTSDINLALAWLVPLNMGLSILILLQNYKDVALRYLFIQLIPLLFLGFLGGSYLSSALPSAILKKIFGLLIIALSLRSLMQNSENNSLTKSICYFWLILGGIVHGLFSTGGPMVVFVVSQTNFNKKQFRATLAALWVILNSLMVFRLTYFNDLSISTLKTSLSLLPALLCSILAGNYLFHKISEKSFRRVIYALLLFAGIMFLIR